MASIIIIYSRRRRIAVSEFYVFSVILLCVFDDICQNDLTRALLISYQTLIRSHANLFSRSFFNIMRTPIRHSSPLISFKEKVKKNSKKIPCVRTNLFAPQALHLLLLLLQKSYIDHWSRRSHGGHIFPSLLANQIFVTLYLL